MSWPSFFAGVLAAYFFSALVSFIVAVFLNADRTDELSNQGADEGGRGFIQHDVERK